MLKVVLLLPFLLLYMFLAAYAVRRWGTIAALIIFALSVVDVIFAMRSPHFQADSTRLSSPTFALLAIAIGFWWRRVKRH